MGHVRFGFEVMAVPGRAMYREQTILGTNLPVSSGGQACCPVMIGKAKDLQIFLHERFTSLSSNTGTIGIEITPIPLFKIPMLAELALQLIPVTTLGVLVVKVGKFAMEMTNMLTSSSGTYKMRFIANYNRSLYSTTDIVIQGEKGYQDLVLGTDYLQIALKKWFDKQNNKSHSIKTMFRGSSHPYFMKADGTLGSYGEECSVPNNMEVTEEAR
jgi:hypothetical protein